MKKGTGEEQPGGLEEGDRGRKGRREKQQRKRGLKDVYVTIATTELQSYITCERLYHAIISCYGNKVLLVAD